MRLPGLSHPVAPAWLLPLVGALLTAASPSEVPAPVSWAPAGRSVRDGPASSQKSGLFIKSNSVWRKLESVVFEPCPQGGSRFHRQNSG